MYLEFLEALREPIRVKAGLPAGGVVVFAQQDLIELVANACNSYGCVVLLGLTGGRAEVERKAKLNAVENTLEVEVWTPEILISGQTITTMALAEKLQAFLHGYRLADVPAQNGGARVPRFRGYQLRSERQDPDQGGGKYMVANLQFEVLLNPSDA